MNKLLCCILFTATSLTLSAQKIYFIYLQTESEQPFYVRMNNKVHSSSASGYLILPKLQDSTYAFTVGFPQNKWPEQNFSVAMNRKDHGFLLKNFGEKGWGLFDLQTLAVQMGTGGNAKAAIPGVNQEVSPFTEVLARAADDPSLKEKPVQVKVEEKKAEVAVQEAPKKEEPVVVKSAAVIEPLPEKKEEVIAEVKSGTAVKQEPEKKEAPVRIKEENAATAIINVEGAKDEPVPEAKPAIVKQEEVKPAIQEELTATPAEEYKASVVTRKSESSTTEGFGLVFLDKHANGDNDTIRLLIPNPKPLVTPVKEEPKEEKKMLDIPVEITKVEEKAPEIKPAVVADVPATTPVAKTTCAETAVEADFFKLRKSMAAAESDDDMISEAKKYFKNKCFSTAQIKNLGALFLTDEGKYKFFDTAYSYVADQENFSTLHAELKDEYYVTRFKAMLRN